MDNEVGIRELQQHASAVIKRVKTGETLVVTERGVPVATLHPFVVTTLDEMVRAGLASAPTEDLDEVLRDIPLGPVSTAGSDALEALRSDDRL